MALNGIPSINRQISCLGMLDYCGSCGNALLEAIDYTDKGSEVEKLQKQVELITELSAIKSTIISEIRYLYSIAYGFVKKIAETKEPPTDSWSSFVAEAEKFVNNAADISDLKIGPFFTRLDSLYKELKDVTKDGSV